MSLCGRSRAILSFPVHELSGVEDVPRVEGELHALYQLTLCLVEEDLPVEVTVGNSSSPSRKNFM